MTGDQTIPQSLNRFGYVKGNPLKYVDPTGHVPDVTSAQTTIASGVNYLYENRSTLSSQLETLGNYVQANGGAWVDSGLKTAAFFSGLTFKRETERAQGWQGTFLRTKYAIQDAGTFGAWGRQEELLGAYSAGKIGGVDAAVLTGVNLALSLIDVLATFGTGGSAAGSKLLSKATGKAAGLNAGVGILTKFGWETESPRVPRRPQTLRGWGHEQECTLLARSPRTGGSAGP